MEEYDSSGYSIKYIFEITNLSKDELEEILFNNIEDTLDDYDLELIFI